MRYTGRSIEKTWEGKTCIMTNAGTQLARNSVRVTRGGLLGGANGMRKIFQTRCTLASPHHDVVAAAADGIYTTLSIKTFPSLSSRAHRKKLGSARAGNEFRNGAPCSRALRALSIFLSLSLLASVFPAREPAEKFVIAVLRRGVFVNIQ